VKKIALLLAALAPLLALAAGKFTVESAEVKPNQKIADAHVFKGFGCEGGNVSPSLAWKDPPAGTKSFAITVYDPDAPTGSGWWHWVVFNIPANVMSLPAGADFGKPGYGGPCPPPGDKPHHYVFKVFALKTDKLDLDESASGALVGYMLNADKLGTAEFTATYGRK